MTSHQIVCTEQTGCTTSGHIIAVGIGTDRSSASTRMTVQDVYTAIDRGDRFYTSDASGNTAWVEKWKCGCGRGTLRSNPDASRANNLDNLRLCSWRS